MKHTKNILKSLLITVMALSLLAVSCKKDEGGTKNPVKPTPITITADDINSFLSFDNFSVGNFKITTKTNPIDYKQAVEITVQNSSGSGNVKGNDFKAAIENNITSLSSLLDGANTVIDGTITAQTSGNTAMQVKLKVTPISPNKFDDGVAGVSQGA